MSCRWKWQHCLLGHQFTVYTNQKAFRHILEQREAPHKMQKWVTKLMGHAFEIFYRSGSKNKATDALSHMPKEAQLNVIIVPLLHDVSVVEEEI